MTSTKEQIKQVRDIFTKALNKAWDSLSDEDANALDEELSTNQNDLNLYENYKKNKENRKVI